MLYECEQKPIPLQRARAGWAAVYVDFFGVLTLDDIAQRIERAYAAELQGKLAGYFAGVRQRQGRSA